MRSLTLAATALCVLGAGCGLFEPSRLVIGQWGGDGILLDASAPAAPRLDLTCSKALFPGTLVLDQAGRLQATARIILGSWRTDDAWLVVGVVSDGEMTVDLTYTSPGYTALRALRYTLKRGAKPRFSGACLA